MTTSSAILVGYFCDVTGEQSPESIAVLSTSGCSRVFVDSQSSSGTELKKAVEALRPGDTLLVPKLDSLGMNLRAMMAFIVRLSAEGVHFRTAGEGIDTREAIRPAHLCRLLLEAGTELRRVKIKNGMREAKKRGEGVGRPKVLQRDDVLAFRQLIATPGVTVRNAADSLGINISTVRKRARSLGISLRTAGAPASSQDPASAVTQGRSSGRRRTGRPRILKSEDVIAFRQLVETSGLSVKRAASELGVSQKALRRWARDLGITLRRRTYSAKADRSPESEFASKPTSRAGRTANRD
jgi:DNA invertase Pin-like site-specific DNA recombinase